MEGKRKEREEKNGEVNCYSVATVPLQGGAGRQHFIGGMWKNSVSVMYSDSANTTATPQHLKWLKRYVGEKGGHIMFSSLLEMLVSCGQLSHKFP